MAGTFLVSGSENSANKFVVTQLKAKTPASRHEPLKVRWCTVKRRSQVTRCMPEGREVQPTVEVWVGGCGRLCVGMRASIGRPHWSMRAI